MLIKTHAAHSMSGTQELFKLARDNVKGTRSLAQEEVTFSRSNAQADDIFSAVKHGDIERLRYLVRAPGQKSVTGLHVSVSSLAVLTA